MMEYEPPAQKEGESERERQQMFSSSFVKLVRSKTTRLKVERSHYSSRLHSVQFSAATFQNTTTRDVDLA